MTKDNDYISKQKFMEELYRFKKGSISRRHFLNVTGLGAATAVMGTAVPGLLASRAHAAGKGAPHLDAAYALINFLLDPQVNAKEVLAHGYPSADANTNKLLPESLLNDPILYPAAELLNALEFGAAVTLTDPNRAELMARFKSA